MRCGIDFVFQDFEIMVEEQARVGTYIGRGWGMHDSCQVVKIQVTFIVCAAAR